MGQWLRPVLAWLALAASLLPAPAFAQATKAGNVTTLEGNVTAVRPIVAQPVPLKFKDDVFLQDRVVTGEQSFARLLLGGKAVVSIRERSAVTITEVPGRSTIEIESGKIALSVARDRMLPGEIINIKTPNAVAGVRGTVVVAEVTRRGGQPFTNLWVIRGIVDAVHTNLQGAPLSPAVTLKAQESLSANPTTSSKGTFTPAQVGAIVQGLQPQRTQEGGSASQSPARLEAVNTAAALLGVLTDTEAGQEQVKLLTGPPPALSTPETRPEQTVTEAPITALTTGAEALQKKEPPPTPDVSDVTINNEFIELIVGRTLKTFSGTSTRTGTSSVISIIDSIVAGSGSTLVIVDPDANATLQAGPLMKVTTSTLDVRSTLDVLRLLLVRGTLTSLGGSALIGFDPVTVNAQTLIEIAAGGKLSLAGPLLTDQNGTITARQDAISVAGTLLGTGPDALVSLKGTNLIAGLVASQGIGRVLSVSSAAPGMVGDAALVSLAGPLLSAVSAPIRLTADVVGIFNGASVVSERSDPAAISPFIKVEGTVVDPLGKQVTNLEAGEVVNGATVINGRIANISGVGGASGTTQASLTLKSGGALLEASGGAFVNVKGADGNVVRLDAALLDATAPLINLVGAQLQTGGHAINLANNSTIESRSAEALIKLENNARMDVLNGHLVNVSASRLNVAGDLVRMGNGTILTVNGVLLNVFNGGIVTINGALVRFTGVGATINVTNTLFPNAFVNGVPVFFAGVIPLNPTIGVGSLVGLNLGDKPNTIKINGTVLPTGANAASGITGSLINVGANGTVRIGTPNPN